jgi:hypothetical protein
MPRVPSDDRGSAITWLRGLLFGGKRHLILLLCQLLCRHGRGLRCSRCRRFSLCHRS